MPIDKSQLTGEVLAHVNELESKITNLVEEIKGERAKKQENEGKVTLLAADLEKAKADLQKLSEGGAQAPKVEEVVQKVFEARDASVAANNRKTAESKFKSLHKEFHDENDAGGIKFGALLAKAKRLNADGLKTEEDFLTLLSEAKILLTTPVTQGTDFNPYASTPNNTVTPPRNTDPNSLSLKEKKLIEYLGWDEKKYLGHKAKRPTYVKKLLDEYSGQ